jgi:hypothetical protein
MHHKQVYNSGPKLTQLSYKGKLTMIPIWALFSCGLFALTNGEGFKLCLGPDNAQCIGAQEGLSFKYL